MRSDDQFPSLNSSVTAKWMMSAKDAPFPFLNLVEDSRYAHFQDANSIVLEPRVWMAFVAINSRKYPKRRFE